MYTLNPFVSNLSSAEQSFHGTLEGCAKVCMQLMNHVDPCLIELSPQSGIEHWLKISAAESQPKTRVRIPLHPHTHTMIQHFKHICMHTYIYPYIDLVGPPVQGHVTEGTVRILLQHVSAGPGDCCGPLQRVSSSSCKRW